MTERTNTPKRRRLLRVIAIGAILAAAGSSLVACGSGGKNGGGGKDEAPVGTIVMVIRHGEKPDEPATGNQPGIGPNGKPDDSSLTKTGYARANALVNVFDPPSGQPRAGLAVPKAIYAAGANSDGEGMRTRETVAPLAQKLGLQVNTDYGKGDEKKLVKQLSAEPGPTLICWQHGELPDIAKAFKSVSPNPPKDWPDERYDVIWTFTKTSDGWSFAQLPESVLPSDQTTLIDS